jgi:hypothetical protein
METYDNQNLIPGTQMKIDYMNWGDHMMMVYCYNESLRFLLTVTEKSRSEAGNMILTGTKEDGTAMSLLLTTGTVLNFSHASLQVGDTVLVYPMNGDADSKTSITPNRVDRIQFRTHRTATKPIID